MMAYRMAIQFYKIYNRTIDKEDWLDMNCQQNFTDRNKFVQISDTSKLRVEKNIMTNRLSILNNKIEYDWLNLSLDSFKIKCKSLFLS